MSEVFIQISGNDTDTKIVPDPAGMIIGRDSSCDIVLDDKQISRKHARLYCDPLGRWLIEDLESYNGIFVENKKVIRHHILPGDLVIIEPFSIKLTGGESEPLHASHSTEVSTSFMDDRVDQTIDFSNVNIDQILSVDGLHLVNRIGEKLASVSSSSDLYRCVCAELAEIPNSMAMVVRIPTDTDLPDSPETLAFSNTTQHSVFPPSNKIKSRETVHVSRRVMEAIRSGKPAVSASSSSQTDIELTITNPVDPRTVQAATITTNAESIDLLYADIPASQVENCPLAIVQSIARQVHLVAKNLQLAEVRAEMEAIDLELSKAQVIQAKLMPNEIDPLAGIDVGLYYKPAAWVGGDYIDVWKTNENHLAFAVGDVAGHGLDAAMMMSNLQAALHVSMSFCSDMQEVMNKLNRHMMQFAPEGKFATMLMGILNPETGNLNYINAGHETPLLFNGNGGPKPLGDPLNPMVGVVGHDYKVSSHMMEPGSGLLVVTDGITETLCPDGSLFGSRGLRKMLLKKRWDSGREVVDALVKEVDEFRRDAPQQDDVTVLAIIKG